MHPCLLIPETLHRISEELDSQSAFPLALTCRAFLEPGLDRLWRDLSSFDPIIARLPEDLLKCTEVQLYDNRVYKKYSFCRELLESDLRRYLSYYAPRIRSFDLNITLDDSMRVLSLDAFNAIKQLTMSQYGVLSPNLTRLRWFVHKHSGAWRADGGFSQQLSPYISLFLGKNVIDFGADLDDGDFEVHRTAIREALDRLGPNMETLQISKIEPEFFGHSGRLCPWDRLRDLQLTSPHIKIIPHLAALPCLSSLLVMYGITGLRRDDDEETISSVANRRLVGKNGFPSLETLHAFCYFDSEIRHLVQHLARRNKLKKIFWEHAGESSKDMVVAFINTVQHYCDPDSLSQITMLDNEHTEWEEMLDNSDSPSLLPLFAFKKLQHVELVVFSGIHITPDILVSIPQNWPDLRQLTLCPTVWRYHSHEIDHTHIVELVHNLPHLQVLGLPFDSTNITASEHLKEPHSKLHTFNVGDSPIASPSLVVAFLKQNFPCIRKVLCTPSTGDRGFLVEQRWMGVVEALEEL